MAIKPPAWAPNAIPTNRGWIDPKTKEILKGGSIAAADIAEYMTPMEAPINPANAPRMLREAPVTEEEAVEELIETPAPRRSWRKKT